MVELGGLSTLVRGSDPQAKVVVVLLHGHAMDAADLAPFALSLNVPAQFYFPQSPRKVRSGGHSWWGVDARGAAAARARGPRDLFRLHPPGRAEARARLAEFLKALEPLRGQRPLLLGGFSQGGMLACDLMLHGESRIDAMALLSASRIAFDDWAPRLNQARDLDILVAHGRSDPDLAFGAGEALRDALVSGGARVHWLPFDGGHEIPLPAWRALRKLIDTVALAAN